MERKYLYGMLMIALLLGAGAWRSCSRPDSKSLPFVKVERGEIKQVVVAEGTVEPLTLADITTKQVGKVVWIVEEGARVRRGEVLIRLDAAELTARLAQAKARSVQANQAYQRALPLYQQQFMSRAEYDQAVANKEIAREQVAELTEMFEETRVRAPFSGRVVKKWKEMGEIAQLGAPLVTLADDSVIRVHAEIQESKVRGLITGQPVTVTADVYPGREFHGVVTHISEKVGKDKIVSDDPSDIRGTKVLLTKINLKEWDEALKFGMTVDIELVVAHHRDVLIIPQRSVLRDRGRTYVKLNQGKDVSLRQVTLGAEDDWRVEVLSGVKEEDQVVGEVNGS